MLPSPNSDAEQTPSIAPTLWRNPAYMLLWSGQVISTLCTSTSTIVYPLLILPLTGSPAAAGLAAAVAHVAAHELGAAAYAIKAARAAAPECEGESAGRLESAVARPRATFDGKELYPDLFTQAAALMDSLINNHPFVDGNKRTGVTAAGLFLRINGWKLTASPKKLESCTLRVATGRMKVAGLADWLRDNTVPVKEK